MTRLALSPQIAVSALRHSKSLLMALIVVTLAACGSNKIVRTVDDSADYKSARALPPLKKPSRALIEESTAPAQPSTEVVVEPQDAPIVDEADEQQEEPDVTEQVALAESELLVDATEPVTQPVEVADEVEAEPETEIAVADLEPVPASPATDSADATPQLTARVVEQENNTSRLQIDAEFEQAWDYLTSNLQKSDVTIFSRNKAAGRFSIGCSGIAEDDDAVEVRKAGGWSFFIRQSDENLEYCALQVDAKRGNTLVSVLNRSGAEVAGQNSASLFERILNN